MSISGQIVSEIVAQLCLENSIQTLPNFFGVDPTLVLYLPTSSAVARDGSRLSNLIIKKSETKEETEREEKNNNVLPSHHPLLLLLLVIPSLHSGPGLRYWWEKSFIVRCHVTSKKPMRAHAVRKKIQLYLTIIRRRRS